jgi:hypothetical protein
MCSGAEGSESHKVHVMHSIFHNEQFERKSLESCFKISIYKVKSLPVNAWNSFNSKIKFLVEAIH